MNGTLQQNRILIVDDDKRVRGLLRMYLEKEQFIVEEASLGWQALSKLHHDSYAMIILDWILPDIKGIEICQYLRTNLSIPVMFLTAKSEEGNRLEAFKAGADDFVMKPFSPREVVLRIKTMMARYNGLIKPASKDHSASEVLISSILINPTSRRVTVEDEEIHMTPKEFDLLYHLATHAEIAFSRQDLLRIVWKVEHEEDLDYRTVDTHVKRLRDKLSEHVPNREDLIQTLWGSVIFFVCLTDAYLEVQEGNMSYKQIKWMILLIPTLTVALWEYVRHRFLLPYISMDLGNWLTPVIVYVVSITLLTRLFLILERIQKELEHEREAKAAFESREKMAKELHDGIAQSLFYYR